MAVRSKDSSLVGGITPSSTAFETLRRSFGGPLLLPDHPAYDAARRVQNRMVDRRPALIARCTGTADVARVLLFARDQGVEVAVRGGGHSIVGHSMIDGAVVIDLSSMRDVYVDAARRRAFVRGGATIGDVDRESQLHGLATTGGFVSSTGVGGLTLGGGYGWLARRFGLACDNVRSAELVTADGSIVTTSVDEHPDLFWAIRGGGGNFGIVTRFEFELHRLGPTVATGDVFYRAADGEAALRVYRDVLATAPDELCVYAEAGVAVPGTRVPDEDIGTLIISIEWGWLGDRPEDGERYARPLHEAAKPIAQYVDRLSYVQIQGAELPDERPDRRFYWKSSFLKTLSDDTLGAFLDAAKVANADGLGARAELVSMGGAISRIGSDETAFRHRDALVDFLAVASWDDAADDETRMGRSRALWQAVADTGTSGVYVNNLGGEGRDRVREAYGPHYERLARIKARYDPDNVFRHNANVPPAAAANND